MFKKFHYGRNWAFAFASVHKQPFPRPITAQLATFPVSLQRPKRSIARCDPSVQPHTVNVWQTGWCACFNGDFSPIDWAVREDADYTILWKWKCLSMICCEYRGLISCVIEFYNYAKVGEIHQCFWHLPWKIVVHSNKLATLKIVVTSPLIFIVYRTSFFSVAIFILKISKSIIKTREGLKDRYTLSNKNPLAWYFVHPTQAVTWHTVATIIRVVYFPHICAFVAFLCLPFMVEKGG